MGSKPSPDYLTIGEACEATGFAPSALRFYESVQLLEPDWVDPHSGYRFFDPQKLYYLNFLKSMKENGVPLSFLKSLLPLPASEQIRRVLTDRVRAVRIQMRKLRDQLLWLTETLEKWENLPTASVGTNQIVELADRTFLTAAPVEGYSFVGYAKARKNLVDRCKRANLRWTDRFVTRFPLDTHRNPMFERATYGLPVFPSESQDKSDVVIAPAGTFATVRVRGSVGVMYEVSRDLCLWAEAQGRSLGPEVEWHHVISTAMTPDPEDFVTDIYWPLG